MEILMGTKEAALLFRLPVVTFPHFPLLKILAIEIFQSVSNLLF